MGFLNMRAQTDKSDQHIFFSKISISIKQTNYTMENALHDFIYLLTSIRKLIRSVSDTRELVNRNPTLAFSME